MEHLFPIVGRTINGDTVFYTGRAGEGWVSANPAEAFMGFSLEGARKRAIYLNRGLQLHGIFFIVPTGDLLHEVRAAKGGC